MPAVQGARKAECPPVLPACEGRYASRGTVDAVQFCRRTVAPLTTVLRPLEVSCTLGSLGDASPGSGSDPSSWLALPARCGPPQFCLPNPKNADCLRKQTASSLMCEIPLILQPLELRTRHLPSSSIHSLLDRWPDFGLLPATLEGCAGKRPPFLAHLRRACRITPLPVMPGRSGQ